MVDIATINTASVPSGGGGTVQYLYKPEVVVTAGVSTNVGNTGAFSYGGRVQMDTGVTQNSFARIQSGHGNFITYVAAESHFVTSWWDSAAPGADGERYVGTGNLADSGTALVFTVDQYGFKNITASSTSTIGTTNGNGTSETATSFTPDGFTTDNVIWLATRTSTTNVVFYEGGTLHATSTTNLPRNAQTEHELHAIANNANTTERMRTSIRNYTYGRDAF